PKSFPLTNESLERKTLTLEKTLAGVCSTPVSRGRSRLPSQPSSSVGLEQEESCGTLTVQVIPCDSRDTAKRTRIAQLECTNLRSAIREPTHSCRAWINQLLFVCAQI